MMDDPLTQEQRSYELPGNQVIEVNHHKRITAAECLFDPSKVGVSQEDETIPKENVTKSSTVAGKKRTKSMGENANDSKISRASAPKRKAKVVAMKALKGKKAKKSVRNTSKRLKLSKGGEDFEDTDDDEYDDWQN